MSISGAYMMKHCKYCNGKYNTVDPLRHSCCGMRYRYAFRSIKKQIYKKMIDITLIHIYIDATFLFQRCGHALVFINKNNELSVCYPKFKAIYEELLDKEIIALQNLFQFTVN